MAYIDVDQTDRYGRTKLHIEAERGNIHKVLTLLEQGADVDLGDDTERTALHYAVLSGHADIVTLLLEEQADANFADENGCTPLHLLRRNEAKILQILIKHGAKINAKNYYDQTLLHLTARKQNIDFIKSLLSLGANPNAQDSEGMTPLLIAAKYDNIQVVEFLLQATDKDGNPLVDQNYSTHNGRSLADFYQNPSKEQCTAFCT